MNTLRSVLFSRGLGPTATIRRRYVHAHTGVSACDMRLILASLQMKRMQIMEEVCVLQSRSCHDCSHVLAQVRADINSVRALP